MHSLVVTIVVLCALFGASLGFKSSALGRCMVSSVESAQCSMPSETEFWTSDAPHSDAVAMRVDYRSKVKIGALITTIVSLMSSPNAVSAKASTEQDFIEALGTCLTSKRVLVPVLDFIEKQNYDGGRTNVNYLLNFLQVQKNAEFLVRAGLDFSDNVDGIDAAVEASAQLSNTLIQLDSTIYTVIFIPGDDSGKPPPAAEKYIKSLKGYYKDSQGRFDTLLALGSEEQLSKAKVVSDKQVADLQKKSPFLFKVKEISQPAFDPKA